MLYVLLQRFGSGSVPTHLVGASLLRGEWKGAVNMILDPREGDILLLSALKDKLSLYTSTSKVFLLAGLDKTIS